MKRFLYIFALLVTVAVSFLSCGEKNEGTEDFDVQFNVPSSVTLKEGAESLTFKILFKKAPLKSDVIVLGDPAGVSHDCAITEITESSFTVALYKGIYSGDYTVGVKRGSTVRTVGKMTVTVDSEEVKPEQGSTVYGVVTCEGKPLQGVVVSDGVEVVATDASGVYQMKSTKKYGYVFVSVPSGYEPSNTGILPNIHIDLTKAGNVAERVDFQLFNAGDQSDYTLLVLGDIHLANKQKDRAQFSEFVTDINSYVSSHSSDRIYGVTLGDMTWDLYWYSKSYCFAEYLADANKISNLVAYHTIGNHDHDMAAAGDFDTILKYKEAIAPDYYSFNIGDLHYVVLDNIYCTNDGSGTSASRTYTCKVTDEQIDWLKKDLSYVSTSAPLVVVMHATMTNMSAAERNKLLGALSGFKKIHFLTGHTHKVANNHTDNWIDHNSGAVCATWWWTGYLVPGIHIGQDGAPGGYQIFSVSGSDLKWQYKPTGKSVDMQFRTYDRNRILLSSAACIPDAPDENKAAFDKVAGIWTTQSTANEVYLNVWNYSPDWKIEVTENGKPLTVTKVSGVADPLHVLTYCVPRMAETASPTFATTACPHMWKVTAGGPSTTLDIKVTDSFGNVYTETMTRPKTFDAENYK